MTKVPATLLRGLFPHGGASSACGQVRAPCGLLQVARTPIRGGPHPRLSRRGRRGADEIVQLAVLFRALLCVAILTSSMWATAVAQPDRPLGERAMDVVHVLADEIGSRPAGTGAERRAATYLSDTLSEMGYAVRTLPFEYGVRSGSGTSQNVEARSNSEDPSLPLVIIGAHYDSVPAGPGANDNGSGTATMVEVARELAKLPVPNVAVRYVAFGAEEIGLLGSADYAQKLSSDDRRRLKVMLSIDMMAVGDRPAFGGSEPWLSEALARAASQGYRPAEASSSLRRMSDHASFMDLGVPALMFHWVDDPFYHTAFDVSDNVQPAAMDLMGAIAIELVRVAARG
ncbi:MAG: peptidase [Chloroflexi bacterium]|nr:peptidase [Chloroflexota bacterium]